MKTSVTRFATLFTLTLALVTFGCTGDDRPSDMPSLQPITVKVVQGGAPLEGASVQLVPEDSSNKWIIGGSTNAAGEAEIMTQARYKGAPLGDYKVTVQKTITDGPAVVVDDPAGSPPVTSYNVVDPNFSTAAKTTSKISVTGTSTVETIDVGPAIKEVVPSL